MNLKPAYGRDYTSAKAVKDDWDANKDFVIVDIVGGNAGRMINKEQAPVGSYSIRYKKLTQVCVIKKAT